MRIDLLLCSEETELHIWSRHRVTQAEAEEAAYRPGLVLRGRSPGVYEVMGRTEAGRYLTIIVRYHGKGVASIITARDMSWAGRRRYDKDRAH